MSEPLKALAFKAVSARKGVGVLVFCSCLCLRCHLDIEYCIMFNLSSSSDKVRSRGQGVFAK